MEANNMAALRRTLMRFLVWAQQDLWEHAWHGQSSANYKKLLDAMVKEISDALAEPPRQCDIGTAGEQSDRFSNLCDSHSGCSQCPVDSLWNFADGRRPPCGILWAQMPYAAEGGAE